MITKRLMKVGGCGLIVLFFVMASDLYAQNQTVSGTVIDAESQKTLPGVNIKVKGTTVGTSTDTDGTYSLEVPSPLDTLVVSYIGYATKQVPVDRRSAVDIEMNEQALQGQEMVVVGYGTQKKVNLTGSISTVSGEKLESRPIVNVGQGLQGVIPNLNVTPQSGDPTESPKFNIRGYESINGGSPLILVDGVPMDINSINPNDIDNVSVLKDAAAEAIYGARAAYGVILVTTKEGSSGKTHVNLETQWSLDKPIFNVDRVDDPYKAVMAWNKANMRTNGQPKYNAPMVEGTKAWSENPDTAPEWGVVNGSLQFYGNNNYQNRVMNDFKLSQKHNLSITGGSENANYYVSFGYLNRPGYLKTNNEKFKRYNILMKGEFEVTNWLTLNEQITYNSEYSNKPHFYNWDVNINSLARVSPTLPVKFPDLDYYIEPGDHDKFAQYTGMYIDNKNFLPYLENGGRNTFTDNDMWLTQRASLTPLKGLEINSKFSYNLYHRDHKNVASKINVVSNDLTTSNMITHGFSGDDWISNPNSYNRYYQFNARATYIMDQFDNHYIKALVGFNQEWANNKYVNATAKSLITPTITDINATVGDQQTSGSSSSYAIRGVFYRLNYNYKERYLIEADGRYDGTSKFPKHDRFGFFPSFSAGWRISNEKFMAGTNNWLTNLKIRASYGSLGNQAVGNRYPYIPTMNIGTSNYIFNGNGNIPYVSAAGLVSPSLTWETVVSKNIGLDFNLLNSRIEGSFDIYSRATKDMLMDVEYPAILGTSAPQSNAADLKTTGWELSLSWRDNMNRNIDYNIGVGLSNHTAKITKYSNPNGDLSDYYVGQKLGEIWGYETEGIFQTNDEVANAADQSRLGANWKPGDIRYADLNGDGIISRGSNTINDPGDRKIIGNTTPKYNFNINGGISYKNFNLSVFFQGVLHRDYWPPSGNWNWFFPFNAGHVEQYYLTETWSEDNRDAYFAAPHISTDTKKNIQTQSRYVQDAGYIRLKNLRLSYDFSTNMMDTIGLRRAQVYIVGMNLWEYSSIHKPLDPESIYSNAITYPMQRILSLGVKVSL